MRINWFRPAAPTDGADELPLMQKLGWFAIISLTSVTIVAISAYALRGLLFL